MFSGDRLRDLRVGRDWTQADVAFEFRAHGQKISSQSVSDWEKGAEPSFGNVMILCKIFGVEPSYFEVRGSEEGVVK